MGDRELDKNDYIDFSARTDGASTMVFGGSGDDTIIGGSSHDWLYGGVGDDVIDGRGGDDHLFGGNGQDDLNGGAGNDDLYGDDDDVQDILTRGRGDDVLHAGNNNIVQNLDENDLVLFNGYELHGGQRTGGDDSSPSGTYKSFFGIIAYVYDESAKTLDVYDASGHMAITNFVPTMAGIYLENIGVIG